MAGLSIALAHVPEKNPEVNVNFGQLPAAASSGKRVSNALLSATVNLRAFAAM
ncbi:MAG: hypothetical protein IJK04_03245 [Kiritimatiellae bacterium]|nr:hypothetical protein [Kiritimatiellia bacterium]